MVWKLGNGSSYKSHVEQNRRIPDPRLEENPQPPSIFIDRRSQTNMFCEEHPISCPLMEIIKPTFYSAIVIMKGEPNYWDILPEALNKTLYVNLLSTKFSELRPIWKKEAQ